MKSLRIGIALLILCSLIFGLWIVSTSSLFQTCVSSQTAEKTQTGKENSPPSILTGANYASIYIRCAGHAIYEYRDAATAIATVFIACFTFTLWRSTKAVVAIANRDFIATHRPRVGVRFIQEIFYENDRQCVWITIANDGGSDAIIRELGADLARRKGKNWLTLGASGNAKKISPITLISGQPYTFKVTAKASYGDAEIFADAMDTVTTHAFGVIRYADKNGTMRETGFFRTYDEASESFIPSENSEEEYQA